LLEEAPNLEETVKLMKFLCWENMSFSLMLINELLWMAAYHYSYELKPHLEMLYHILSVKDSWQLRRIMYALQGISEDREGLFEIIVKSQNHYQKRAYQIIKMLVQLFTTCDPAIDLLNKDEDLKRKWKSSRHWFFNEMEKCRMYNMPNYTYFQTPQSNETSQTYFLERTQSARITLEKAMRICPQNTQGSVTTNTVAGGENDDDQIENDEEDAYESISDEESTRNDDNLEYRSTNSEYRRRKLLNKANTSESTVKPDTSKPK
jgi:ubiquitin carboxyl-terminal hydrolase 9/24